MFKNYKKIIENDRKLSGSLTKICIKRAKIDQKSCQNVEKWVKSDLNYEKNSWKSSKNLTKKGKKCWKLTKNNKKKKKTVENHRKLGYDLTEIVWKCKFFVIFDKFTAF